MFRVGCAYSRSSREARSPTAASRRSQSRKGRRSSSSAARPLLAVIFHNPCLSPFAWAGHGVPGQGGGGGGAGAEKTLGGGSGRPEAAVARGGRRWPCRSRFHRGAPGGG